MTSEEHAKAIRAAIKAAEDDGFNLEADLTYHPWDGSVTKIEVDLWHGSDYLNVFTEDRT